MTILVTGAGGFLGGRLVGVCCARDSAICACTTGANPMHKCWLRCGSSILTPGFRP